VAFPFPSPTALAAAEAAIFVARFAIKAQVQGLNARSVSGCGEENDFGTRRPIFACATSGRNAKKIRTYPRTGQLLAGSLAAAEPGRKSERSTAARFFRVHRRLLLIFKHVRGIGTDRVSIYRLYLVCL
jgi:hypothetical protein